MSCNLLSSVFVEVDAVTVINISLKSPTSAGTTGKMEEPPETNSPNLISNEHQLWLNLSALREGNAFAVLPRIIQEIMYADTSLVPSSNLRQLGIVFPSDPEWRNRIYLKMVEKQRLSVVGSDDENETMADTLHGEKPPKLHEWNLLPKKKPSKPLVCDPEISSSGSRENPPLGPGPITWTVGDLAKAGSILSIPPIHVTFDDEHEMRRVYTLIYDVFRYKNILNEALNDVSFLLVYPQLKDNVAKVWLLLYDFYFRSFKKRETRLMDLVEALFEKAGLMSTENCLCEQRVKLAAAVARLRIKNSALRLCELLPKHLRNDKIVDQNSNTPVTCWVNIRKVKNIEEIRSEIQGTLNIKFIDDATKLRPTPTTFKADKLCPQFFVFDSSLRTVLAQSNMVRNGKLIMQDRSFCLGPATFGKVLSELQLTGYVIQTHVNSPRTTAYLANLLSQNEKIKKLMAFSAGQKKDDYEKYFNELGVTNIAIYQDRFIDIPPDASYLQEVIAVFATPPNSYSAVNDPVDLVCSSGGDLTMLEVLTESEESVEGRERVTQILEEQRRTLQYAMSRPQIQFVLYETHSELRAENEDMVKRTVMEINRIAKLHHASIQGKLAGLPESSSSEMLLDEKEINNNEKFDGEEEDDDEESDDEEFSSNELAESRSGLQLKESDSSYLGDDLYFREVVVPDCDIFDIPKLPDLCTNSDSCLRLEKEGCYLSLMQRRQIIHFDNKFMIQIAEARGLFGNASITSGKSKTSKVAKKKQETTATPTPKAKRRVKSVEIDRISAPTHSSVRHSKQSQETVDCPRHKHEEEPSTSKVPQSRRWWNETTHHLSALRTSLVRQKIVPNLGNKRPSQIHPVARSFTRSVVSTTQKIDEIFAARSKTSKIPVFPKLHLTRNNVRQPKVPLPVTVTLVQFPFRTYY